MLSKRASKRERKSSGEESSDAGSNHGIRKVVNPFHNPSLGWLKKHWMRALLVGSTLGVVRLALGLASLLLVLLWIVLVVQWIPHENKKLARLVLLPVRLGARVLLLCAGIWRIREHGKPAEWDEARVVVSNHTTLMDAIYFTYRLGPSFLAKIEVKHLPVVGACATLMETVFVDRQKSDSRQAAKAAIKRAVQPNRPPLVVFPEGTFTNGLSLMSWKVGAFEPGLQVQPVGIRYPHKRFNPTGVMCEGKDLLGCLCQIYTSMEVFFLPVYAPTPEEQTNPIKFANNVRAMVADCLDIPVTEHSYEDFKLATLASDSNIPQNFEVKEMKRLFGFNVKELESLIKHFHEMDADQTGTVSFKEFRMAMEKNGMPSQQRLSRVMFEIFDQEGLGEVGFIEFVRGLMLLSNHEYSLSVGHDRQKLAWMLYDRDQDGLLSYSELESCMSLTRGIHDSHRDAQVYPEELLRRTSSLITVSAEDFSRFDGDKDGYLTYKEFCNLCDAFEGVARAPVYIAHAVAPHHFPR